MGLHPQNSLLRRPTSNGKRESEREGGGKRKGREGRVRGGASPPPKYFGPEPPLPPVGSGAKP